MLTLEQINTVITAKTPKARAAAIDRSHAVNEAVADGRGLVEFDPKTEQTRTLVEPQK